MLVLRFTKTHTLDRIINYSTLKYFVFLIFVVMQYRRKLITAKISRSTVFCDHAFSVSGKNFLLVELHGPEYAGVQKLRAHCVSVVFAKHSFHENPCNAQCSNRSVIRCMTE